MFFKGILELLCANIASRSNGYAGKIRERANSVKLRGVIRYKPVGAAAELPCGKEQISEAYGSYYLGAAVQEQMCTALEQFCSPSGGVLYIQGCSGTGKTCTIGYLLGLLTLPKEDTKPPKRLAAALAGKAAEYHVVTADLSAAGESLCDIIGQALDCTTAFQVGPDIKRTRSLYQRQLSTRMDAFASAHPGACRLLVLDGLAEFFESRSEDDIQDDLLFYTALCNITEKSPLRIIAGVDARLFDEDNGCRARKTLQQDSANTARITLDSAVVMEVLQHCCIRKSKTQQQEIAAYLQQFAMQFPELRLHLADYVAAYPFHPGLITLLNDYPVLRELPLLETLSSLVESRLEHELAQNRPSILTYEDLWRSCVLPMAADSAAPALHAAAVRASELEQRIAALALPAQENALVTQVVNALLLRQLLFRNPAATGMTPEQIRDDLFPAGDTAVIQHAITVEQYVEQILTRIISFSAQPLLWLDSACGCYCLAVEKRDNYNKKITLEQLSQLINISRTTIYKVINGKGRVSESTRALVEKALLEYNYVPNFNARDLAYHKTYRIGYIGMAHYGSTFFSKLMQDGIRKALAELEDNGLQIVSAISYILEPQQQITDIERMLQSGIRAFIIVPCDPKVLEPEIKKLRELHCDIIYLSRYVEKKDRVFVGIDYPQSGRLAAEMMSKMLPQGGNIAITTSNFLEDDLWVKQRYDGFVDYLKGRSSYRILGLWDTISDEKSAELICQELMEKHPDISGIYDISYKSEAIARRLVRMRRDQDIKLIGFDYYDAVKPFIRSSAIDVIIGQSLPNQAYDAVKMMFYHLCYGVPLVNKNYNSRLDVIVSSNMDYFEG